MVFEEDSLDVSFLVAGDLSSYQYYFVKMGADNTVVKCTATTDVPIGVLQNKPTAAGQAARVRIHGVSRVVCSAAITFGQLVGTAAAGSGVAITADKKKIAGICLVGGDTSTPATVLITTRSQIGA